MSLSVGMMLGVAGIFALVMVLFYLWARRSQQFEDIEGIKYRMLDLEED
jgi:cbb3-type cytochrome oxidase maturation protein